MIPALALVVTGAVLILRHSRAAQANLDAVDCARNSTQPQKLASGSLTSDYLLLRLVGPKQLSSVSWVVDWPQYSSDAGRVPASIPRVDGQAETIVALQPDLVVVAAYSTPGLATELRALGTSVFELRLADRLEVVVDDVERLGNCIGAAALSHDWAAQIRSRIAAVERRATARAQTRVLVVDEGFAQGRGTLVDDLLNKLGVVNPARETGLEGGVQLDAERLLNWRPDVVFVAVQGTRVIADATEVLSSIPGWSLFAHAPERKPRRIVGIPRSQIEAVSPLAVDALETMDRTIREMLR
jgi:iron complex transport system substrate-binding protein